MAEMSNYYMALEVRQTYVGMMVALPPRAWSVFHNLNATELAGWMRRLARQVQPGRYRKAHRGPKKPPPPREKYQNGRHVSTHRVLEDRRP